MDPVTIGAVLAAIVGGAGGALGGQVWAGVTALVRRPFSRAHLLGTLWLSCRAARRNWRRWSRPRLMSGGLWRLAEVLVARAEADRGSGRRWRPGGSRPARFVGGNVTNTISGGTQYGPVLQGRDFTGLTFGSPAAPDPPGGPRH